MSRSFFSGFPVGIYAGVFFILISLSAGADTPRNLVLMLGDGMGPAQVKAYRMYADDPATELIDPLPMDALLVGAVASDSIANDCLGQGAQAKCGRDPYGFTDSASSATAYATGQDTEVEHLSVDLSGQPLRTILEQARMNGKSTGMVVTSEVMHASPAAFASHWGDREQFNPIVDQYFDLQWSGEPMVEVVMGGGRDYLQRKDRDLVSEFRQAGYQVAMNREEMLAMDGNRLLGLFAAEGLPRAWDRDADIPSLAEMTGLALGTLNRNPEGFFLFIEGSQIDWAAHDNSAPGVVSEMEDFVAAVRVVLEFGQSSGDTLIVITADHETGGMSIGRDNIYRWDPRPMRGMTATPEKMTAEFLAGGKLLSAIVAAHVSFELSRPEIDLLDAAEDNEESVRAAVNRLFDRRTLTGWSSRGHTAVDVPLYAVGPGAERFHGVMQNEALGRALWETFLPADQ